MRNLSKRLPIRGRGYSLARKSCGPLACNAYAVVCESIKDAAVIDPSFSTPHEFQALAKFLEDREANLKHVLLTHGHPDHVFGIFELMKAWLQASLFLHPLEEPNYNKARQVGLDFGLRFPGDDDEALPTPTNTLTDGDLLTIGKSIKLSVVHAPGHAPGHVAFVD